MIIINRRLYHKPLPMKSALLSGFLLLIGIVFGIIGLIFLYKYRFNDDRTIPFLVIAFISFVPGSYHSVILLLAWLNKPGYSYDMVPSFND